MNRQKFIPAVISCAILGSAPAQVLFENNFDADDGGFTSTSNGPASIPWIYNSGSGTWSVDGENVGESVNNYLTSGAISVASEGYLEIEFEHKYSFEAAFDGGALQMSIDGGPLELVSTRAFTSGPYDSAALTGQHELEGLPGFNGDSPDVAIASYITSVAAPAVKIPAGSDVTFRLLAAFDQNTIGAILPNWEVTSFKVTLLEDGDNDGLPDKYENANGLNPGNASDAAEDADSDNVSNLDEFLQGTDPQDDDTDDDNLTDDLESNSGTYVDASDFGTDPLNPDSDGDGLLDGAENPNLPFVDQDQAGTNPTSTDSDNDGFTDGEEALLSTSDPTDENSTPLRAGLLDILAYWNFDDATDPAKTVDLVKGFEGTLLLGGTADPGVTTTYTADGEGHTGEAGDRAIDLGNVGANGTGVRVELGEIFNIAAKQNQAAISYWQKLNAVTASSPFRAVAPSVNGNARGYSAHSPWSNGAIFFDTAGCCNGQTQRISGNGDSLATLDEWRHVVFQKNGDEKEVWVDGVLVLSGISTAPLPTDFNAFFMGTDQSGINMTGQIDDFAVFADSLSDEEILKLANGDDPLSLVPSNDDLDNDGIPDDYETANGLDVNVNDADDDLDMDGSTNLAEFQNQTDPQDDDSDDDDLKDGVETNTGTWVSVNDTGTDPLKADTDGDTLNDGLENPDLPFVDATQPGTDPNLADTDADTFGDEEELQFNSDPTRADSVPDTGALELLVYFNFNGQTVDQTGNAPDAVLAGDAVLSTGGLGLSGTAGDEALDLRVAGVGSAATVAAGDHFGAINLNNSAAVSFWQNNEVEKNSSAFWLITPGGGANERGFQAHTPWGDGTTYFDVAGQTGGAGRLTSNGFSMTGQWQHFVFQKSREGILEIWIDGVMQATSVDAPDLLPLDGEFFIGAEGNTLNNTFNGLIDDFGIFSNVLSADQIDLLANGTTPEELFGPLTDFVITKVSYDAATSRTTLTWNSRNGALYSVDTSSDLVNWEEVVDDVDSQGSSTEFEVPAQVGPEKLFFRIRIVE